MKKLTELFKLLSDESRLRILMLVDRKELCVCQIMGVLGLSQPLISRSLSILVRAGFLDNRREGKMIFYRVRKRLPRRHSLVLSAVRELVSNDRSFLRDVESLQECEEFQKRTGKCGMEGLRLFMMERKKKMGRR